MRVVQNNGKMCNNLECGSMPPALPTNPSRGNEVQPRRSADALVRDCPADASSAAPSQAQTLPHHNHHPLIFVSHQHCGRGVRTTITDESVRATPRPARSISATAAALVISLLVLILSGCGKKSDPGSLEVKSWKTWVLPNDGATQPTPRSMTVGPDDQLAVLDTAGRVLIYNAAGELQRQWKMLDVQYGKPEGIVWLKDQRLVVCDTHYFRLVWFDLEGHVLKMTGQRGREHGEFDFPVGICKDADENLYVCEYGGHDRVQKFTKEGEWLAVIGSAGTGPGQFQRPSGLVWHAGELLIADAVNNRIHRFTDTGKFLGLLGQPTPLALNLPYDITLAPDGQLYIIEYGSGRLSKVSLDGKLLGQFGKTGTGEGEFATPWGLTVDSKMRVFIADTKNRRIVALQL